MGGKDVSNVSLEIVINKVLCYVTTAVQSMKKDDIIRVCLSFYKEEDIILAKDLIYKTVGEKPKRRRHENKMLNEMHDLLDILKRCEESDIPLPKYVADSYDSLPPTSGFDVIADKMVSLNEEISLLKDEIRFLKESRLAENVANHDTVLIKEDILVIKGELRKLNHKLLGNEMRRSSLLLQSLDKPLLSASGKYENDNDEKVTGSVDAAVGLIDLDNDFCG